MHHSNVFGKNSQASAYNLWPAYYSRATLQHRVRAISLSRTETKNKTKTQKRQAGHSCPIRRKHTHDQACTSLAGYMAVSHLVHALHHPPLYGGDLVPREKAELADDPSRDVLRQQVLVPARGYSSSSTPTPENDNDQTKQSSQNPSGKETTQPVFCCCCCCCCCFVLSISCSLRKPKLPACHDPAYLAPTAPRAPSKPHGSTSK